MAQIAKMDPVPTIETLWVAGLSRSPDCHRKEY